MPEKGVRASIFRFAGVGVVMLGVGATACTNLQDVVQAKDQGSGSAVVYPVTERQAWQITNAILDLKRSSPAPREWRGDGYVLQAIQVSSLSSGAYLGVWVEAVGPQQTKVTFLRKRRGTADTVRALTDREFHHDFATLMGLTTGACATESGPPAGRDAAPTATTGAAGGPVASALIDGGSPDIVDGGRLAPARSAEDETSHPPPPVAESSLPTAGAGEGAIREVPLPLPRSGRVVTPPAASAGSPATSPTASNMAPSSAPPLREVPLPPRRVR